MDCSTYSNRTTINDTNDFTQSDISEQYFTIKKQLETCTNNYQISLQELHETKRNYQTALDVQRDITLELESYREAEGKQNNELSIKVQALQEEIHNLREERTKITETNATDIEKLHLKIKDLEERLSFKVEEKVHDETVTNSEDALELRNENGSLLQAVGNLKTDLEKNEAIVLALREQLCMLNEELGCVKSNLDGKKDELVEANENLQSTQNELALANMELQRLKNEGVNHAAKGNSLFAEVEDKRQEMAKTVINMKQQNSQLKRELANKQVEVDTLLREKKTLWEEYTGMSDHHDAELISAYEERITHLEATVERQRRDITSWYNKYYAPASDACAEWVAGVLDHLQKKCESFEEELTAASIENLSKASQIRDLHKQIGSWKLKAMESGTAIQQLQKQLQENHIDIHVPKERPVKPEIKLNLKNSPTDQVKKEDVKKKVTF